MLNLLKQKPAAANVIEFYLVELQDKYHEHERVIALVSKVLPGIEKNEPVWTARLLELRADSILWGRYGQTRERRQLNQAKNDLILAVTFNENNSQANLALGVVYAIDGNIERAKLYLQRGIDTADVSRTAMAEAVANMRWFLSLANDHPNDFVEVAKRFYLSQVGQSKP